MVAPNVNVLKKYPKQKLSKAAQTRLKNTSGKNYIGQTRSELAMINRGAGAVKSAVNRQNKVIARPSNSGYNPNSAVSPNTQTKIGTAVKYGQTQQKPGDMAVSALKGSSVLKKSASKYDAAKVAGAAKAVLNRGWPGKVNARTKKYGNYDAPKRKFF